MRHLPLLLLLAVALGVASGCTDDERPVDLPVSMHQAAITIEAVAMARCDTPPELVDGLSRQLVDAINCLRPGTLAEIPLGAQITMLRAGRPNIIDARALDALRAAAADGDRQLVVRWAYRDVALQHLFWLQDGFRGCAVAAPAGLSNHQNGLAVDLDDSQVWEPVMRAHGWANDLPNDRVHFDYQRAPDVGLGALSLLAFQALWNLNHADAPLALTAELDDATYEALSRAPIAGFATELCEGGEPPIDPGPIRGPTVGQAAWRGCAAPPELIAGLSTQVVEAANCLQPEALVPLRLCNGPGCLRVAAGENPLPWLGAAAHAALLDASRQTGAPISLRWAFRDVALQHFFDSTADNIGCRPPAGGSDLTTGDAIWLSDPDALADALIEAGFSNDDTELDAIWAYEGLGVDDLRPLAILAFQRLWNTNRADDPIDEDGRIGPQTRGAIDRAPVAGFARGICPEPPEMGVPDAGLPDAEPFDAAVPEDAGPRRDAGPVDDATPGEDRGPPMRPDGATPRPDSALTHDAGARDASPQRDGGGGGGLGPLPPGYPGPAPGWSSLSEDAGGCQTQPGSPPPWPLFGLVLLLIARRRRLLRADKTASPGRG
ncbi:MAG: D-alanyl-D-alanine carboxypeptidase family protein [Myxococcales bacterium]|nr:D-alanyl-D-alanine carboxypeptidase family protein [Myxococcales bacterium]